MTSGSTLLRIVAGLLGKAWNLPNTLLGLTYGAIGYVAGLMARTNPRVTFGNNAVQFHNNPLMLSAMALGNVIIYAPSRSPEMPNVPFSNSPPGQTVGREEYRHTPQAQ
jgi:hypothetical protein